MLYRSATCPTKCCYRHNTAAKLSVFAFISLSYLLRTNILGFHTLKVLVVILALTTCIITKAGENESNHDQSVYMIDNDMLSHSLCKSTGLCAENKDRSYTGGFGYGVRMRDDKFLFIRKKHEWLHNGYSKSGKLFQNVGLTVFTPKDLSTPVPIYDDRPFGAMLYYSTLFASLNDDDPSKAKRTQLTLAILGLDMPGDAQRVIHCDWDKGECPVEGWRNDINASEDIGFTFGNSWLSLDYRSDNIEIIREIGYNVGIYNEAFIGYTFRFGQESDSYHLFIPDPFTQSAKAIPGEIKKDFYWWLSIKGSYMAYNAMLRGWHLFSDSGPVSFDDDDVHHGILSGSLGVTFPVPCTKNDTLTFKIQSRSSEIKGPNDQSHAWGGIYYTNNFSM